MKKLWMRAGVSLMLTDEEIDEILGGCEGSAGQEAVVKALREGRFAFNGDSYIPRITVEEFTKEHGLPYAAKEPEFDFAPLGGFRISSDESAGPDESGDQEGICPVCGATIKYGDSEPMDNGGVHHWNCPECGASGKEGYNEVFDGHHYCVIDGNGDPFPPKEAE